MGEQSRTPADFWYKIEDYAAALMLIGMILLVVLQVLFRYVFHVSPMGAEEMARYLMIWISFLVAGAAVRTGEHISIDILPMVLKNERLIKGVRVFLDFVTLIAVGIFFILSAKYLAYNLSSGERSIALRFPMWLPTACVFIGALMMTVYSAIRVINDLRGKQSWK